MRNLLKKVLFIKDTKTLVVCMSLNLLMTVTYVTFLYLSTL